VSPRGGAGDHCARALAARSLKFVVGGRLPSRLRRLAPNTAERMRAFCRAASRPAHARSLPIAGRRPLQRPFSGGLLGFPNQKVHAAKDRAGRHDDPGDEHDASHALTTQSNRQGTMPQRAADCLGALTRKTISPHRRPRQAHSDPFLSLVGRQRRIRTTPPISRAILPRHVEFLW
jgi:hypothetical protein